MKGVIVLTSVCCLAALLLAGADTLTSDIRAERQTSVFDDALHALFPGMTSSQGTDSITVYDGRTVLGTAYRTSARGYASEIELLVGVTPDRTVAGVIVLGQQETPGLGTRITEPSFLAQFVGVGVDGAQLSQRGGRIDGITGATVSSQAVTDAVRSVLEAAR